MEADVTDKNHIEQIGEGSQKVFGAKVFALFFRRTRNLKAESR